MFSVITTVLSKVLAAPRWVWIAGAVLGLLFGLRMLVAEANDALNKSATRGEEVGQARAENAGMRTTIDQIGAANEKVEAIRNDAGHARFCQCMRNVVPELSSSCARYLQDKSVPADGASAVASCTRSGSR